jgi:hypothetical protein
LHAVAACLNAGDRMSTEFGIGMNTPLRPTTALSAVGLDGGLV